MTSAVPTPWQEAGIAGAGSSALREVTAANLATGAVGIYSICSANPFVLQAGIAQARRDRTLLLVESTSNQVNQYGGYSGMTPTSFAEWVRSATSTAGLAAAQILLGGDHLGPYPWRSEPSAVAMDRAAALVRSCADAGYVKLHVDASMACADDPPGPLDPVIATHRAALLCAAAEQAWRRSPHRSVPPVYVVGTEVPIPGGEIAGQTRPSVTDVGALDHTLTATREAFIEAGIADAWQRVIAIVVQPGVEFGEDIVYDYDRSASSALSSFAARRGSIVFEAHSTDYQTLPALRAMVADHFAILKVGPALTFAMREALFALAAIEDELLGRRRAAASNLRAELGRAMAERPEHWRAYYVGDEDSSRLARDFSFSDRSRYYWPEPNVQVAISRLLTNLSNTLIPLPLLSQYLPLQHRAVRAGTLQPTPTELIVDKVLNVIDGYADACGMRSRETSVVEALPLTA